MLPFTLMLDLHSTNETTHVYGTVSCRQFWLSCFVVVPTHGSARHVCALATAKARLSMRTHSWWWHLWLEMFFYEPSHPEPLSMALPRVACFLMGGLFRRGALLLPLLHHGAAGPHGGWDQTPGVDEPTSQTTCTSAWPQPRLTHEQHSLYMAAAWDEDVGLAVQLEDYEMAGENPAD